MPPNPDSNLIASEDRLIGTAWIAQRLGVSRIYAYELINNGTFGPVYDVGSTDTRRVLRVHKTAVEDWLAGRQQASA